MWNEVMVRSFLSLAQTSNFTKAAEQVFFTQQAVSKHIARLESALGCQLFIRERNNLHLTPEGEIYYKAFEQAMKIIDEAEKEASKLNADKNQCVRLAHLAMLKVSPIWRSFSTLFHKTYPNISVETESYGEENIVTHLLQDDVDAIVTFCNEESAGKLGLSYIVFEQPVPEQLCVHKDYPGAQEASSYLDFKNAPVLLPDYDREFAKSRLKGIGFDESQAVFTHNIASAMHLIDMQEGVIIVNRQTKYESSSDLMYFDLPIVSQALALIWKKKQVSPPLQKMIKLLKENL